ncbi:hypothetical protein [Ramlibacter albus]|uniref:Uncharacterized protein n=1 Tax=Ramlibacter albus TaxID=2079448 RepID=A0A923S527_9BURK|nr:hypothetical protein [Ramlibacter albus]MBC5764737.1 hypothetical protein [Ramlibacter albus]
MPDTTKQPDPALLASIAADIEAGRMADAQTLIAQVEAEGYGGEALAALKERLLRGQFADALAGQLRALVSDGLPQPQLPKNRAQRRAEARKRTKSGKR